MNKSMINFAPIILKGCSPEPLISYLKALGIFRVISDQMEPDIRACWKDNSFVLHSRHTANEITDFFLEKYSPTPIVSPWNGGSGFYEGDQDKGIQSIRNSSSDRLEDYRVTINAIFQWQLLPPRDQTVKDIIEWFENKAADAIGKQKDSFLKTVRKIRNALDRSKQYLPEDTLLEMTVEVLKSEKGTLTPVVARTALAGFISATKKARTEIKKSIRKENKDLIIMACRDRLNDRVVEWLDAVAVINNEGKTILSPILGTGGIEGHLEYSTTFMSMVSDLFINPIHGDTKELLSNSLFGTTTSKFKIYSIGQYDPGRAGGFNQGTGVEHKAIPINPWDFVLAMEGCLVWASSLNRRKGISSSRLASIPFTVRAQGIGYGSSSEKDDEKAKAEIWAPLWERPATYREFRKFIGEGRADVGRHQATNTIEFAEAIASLGVDRGVNEFVRYSLIERRGQSNIALPAGRFRVQERKESDLARELKKPLYSLDRFLRSIPAGPPASYSSCRREIDRAIYSLLLNGGTSRVKKLLVTIGRMEKILALRDPNKEPALNQPLTGLSTRWLDAADDGSIELRIAASVASIVGTGGVGPLRSNLIPVDPGSPSKWAATGNQVAWSGSSLCNKLAGVLGKRMLVANQNNCESNPTFGLVSLHPGDVMSLLEGLVDEQEVEDLLFGLTWVRWKRDKILNNIYLRWSTPVQPVCISRAWAILKLIFWPEPIIDPNTRKKIILRPEPGLLPLLRAGRIEEAVSLARHRLFVSGLKPTMSTFNFSFPYPGNRLAASLLIPVRSLQSFSYLVLTKEKTT